MEDHWEKGVREVELIRNVNVCRQAKSFASAYHHVRIGRFPVDENAVYHAASRLGAKKTHE
jgi:hypothetical protein